MRFVFPKEVEAIAFVTFGSRAGSFASGVRPPTIFVTHKPYPVGLKKRAASLIVLKA